MNYRLKNLGSQQKVSDLLDSVIKSHKQLVDVLFIVPDESKKIYTFNEPQKK